MPDTPIQFTGSILERFETKVAAEAAHLLPIVHAIRDHGVGFLECNPIKLNRWGFPRFVICDSS